MEATVQELVYGQLFIWQILKQIPYFFWESLKTANDKGEHISVNSWLAVFSFQVVLLFLERIEQSKQENLYFYSREYAKTIMFVSTHTCIWHLDCFENDSCNKRPCWRNCMQGCWGATCRVHIHGQTRSQSFETVSDKQRCNILLDSSWVLLLNTASTMQIAQ